MTGKSMKEKVNHHACTRVSPPLCLWSSSAQWLNWIFDLSSPKLYLLRIKCVWCIWLNLNSYVSMHYKILLFLQVMWYIIICCFPPYFSKLWEVRYRELIQLQISCVAVSKHLIFYFTRDLYLWGFWEWGTIYVNRKCGAFFFSFF